MPAISKDIPNVTVCNFRDWSVGADCDFEPWIEYADASSYISAAFDGTAAIFQSDVRFPSAAKSREECCNLCRINGACTHFVFRNPENGENSCQLKDSGKDPTVRNKTGDDFGPFGLPAYVSGFPAKSRHAGILLAPSAAGPFVSSFAAPAFTRSSLNAANQYKYTMYVKLNMPPRRGSVSVGIDSETYGDGRVGISSSDSVTFFSTNYDEPQKVALTISFLSGLSNVGITQSKVIVNFIITRACDEAFSSYADDCELSLDLEFPSGDADHSHTIIIGIAGIIVYCVLAASFMMYGNKLKRSVLFSLGKETLVVFASSAVEILDITSSYFMYFDVVRNSLDLEDFKNIFFVVLVLSTIPSLASLIEFWRQGYIIWKESRAQERNDLFEVLAYVIVKKKESNLRIDRHKSQAMQSISVMTGIKDSFCSCCGGRMADDESDRVQKKKLKSMLPSGTP